MLGHTGGRASSRRGGGMAWRAQPDEAFLKLVFRSAVGSVLAGSIYTAATPGRAWGDEEPIGRWLCEAAESIDVYVLHPRVKLDYLSSRGGGRIWKAVGLPCR